MSEEHPLVKLLGELAARRRLQLRSSHMIVGPPPGPMEGVSAFTGINVVATSVPAAEISERLDPADLNGPLRINFLAWLAQRLERPPSLQQVVCVRLALGGGAPSLVPTNVLDEHPRVKRARRTREDVTVYRDRDGLGFVIFGRGLALRWEISYELEAVQRGRGQSQQLIETALRLLPAGEAVYAQIPPGNAASLRAALATGFRPIGTEVLFKSSSIGPVAELRPSRPR